jgi:hypothetical protein
VGADEIVRRAAPAVGAAGAWAATPATAGAAPRAAAGWDAGSTDVAPRVVPGGPVPAGPRAPRGPAGPRRPAPPPRRGAAGVVVALVLLLALGVVIALLASALLGGDDGDDDDTAAPGETTTSAVVETSTSTIAAETTTATAPTTAVPETTTTTSARVGAGWIAVLGSLATGTTTEQQAAERAASYTGQGVTAGYLLSDDYQPSLNAGFWVVYVGPVGTDDEAEAICAQLGLAMPSQCYTRELAG